jgi:cyclopropane fatty-acyl-phospholipid synthase-like methyltransferase
MGLVARGPGGWANTGLAERTLVSGSPADQRDMVLHNTQPEYVGRVFSFGERLGLPPDRSEPEDFHPGFLKAMSNTAAAGQADALVAAVDLTDCRTLLDVGGATGPYAIALCRAYPNLSVAILDQPATIPIATPILESSGLAERIRIEAHDYRSGAFPGPVDAMLISNVLRGESQEAIDDILARAHAALSPGGHLLIVDLFLEDPPAGPGLSAALFGLHVPDGANYSFAQMVQAVQRTGFQVSRVERLTRSVVMNGIVEAVRT